MKTRLALVLVLAGASGAALADSPFCVVSQFGQASCFYYSLDACRQAARSQNGVCAVNVQQPAQAVVQPAPQPTIQPYQNRFAESQRAVMDGGRYVQEQGEAGRRRREEQAERQARMQLLQAQIDSQRMQARAPADSPPPPAAPTYAPSAQQVQAPPRQPRAVVYMCSRGQHEPSEFTRVPAVGCIVSSVEW